MSYLNHCQFIGRIAGDPVVAEFPGQKIRAEFSVAIRSDWKDPDGHRQSQIIYVDFVAWQAMANVCKKFVRKGALVYARGRMDISKYEVAGQKRKKTRIVLEHLRFLSKAQKDGEAEPEQPEAEGDGSPF